MTNLDKLRETLKLVYDNPDAVISKFDRFITDDYWEKEYNPINDNYSWVCLDKEYYYIDKTGDIKITRHFDQKSSNDVNTLNKKIAIGNVFRYQIDAENEVERLKICAKLKELADCKYDEEGYFWVITYNNVLNEVGWTRCAVSIPSEYYFSSKEACVKAIEIIGAENLKKYYFRIE